MNGLDSNLISLRRGVSYWEAVEQLVPRTFGPDRPGFNLETNHVLAQTIGLVGRADNDTSWGVNYLAETVWNFGLVSLPVALPVTFTLSTWLDRALHGWLKHPVALLVIEGALFFKFMDLVGMVNTTTYVFWICVMGVAVDKLSGSPTTERKSLKQMRVTVEAHS